MRKVVLALGLGIVAIWGCGGAGATGETTAGTGASGVGGAGSSSSGTVSTSSGTVASGLPCDVAMVLQNHCWSCHGSVPSGGAPNAMVTLAQLTASAKSDPSKTVAQVAAARMNDPASPMPPKPASPVPASERAVFESWVNAGTPAGSCDGGTGGAGPGTGGSGGSPYDTPPTCSSNTFWMSGDQGSDLMHPGKPCKSCHVLLGKATGKTFDVGGTVYLTAHEPDDCNGVSVSGAQVVITDGMGQDHVLDVNGAGNFYHQDLFGFAAFPLPIRAKVVYQGKERVMMAPQMNGDCNSCHNEAGTSNAPGRIMLP